MSKLMESKKDVSHTGILHQSYLSHYVQRFISLFGWTFELYTASAKHQVSCGSMPVHSGTRSRGVSHRVSHGSGKKSPDSANCIIAVSNEVSTRLRTARNQLLLRRTGSNSLRNASNLFPPGSVVNLVSALSVGVLAVSR